MRRELVWVSLCVAGPGGLLGQESGPYRLSERDTLRYNEISHAEIGVDMPQGTMLVLSEHDATIAIQATGPQSARAWYEALYLRSVGPDGEQTPSTTSLLGAPYDLTFSGRGRLEVLSTPPFPEPVAAITNLSHQFLDFWVPMPRAKPNVGEVWQDTIRSTVSANSTIDHWFEAVRRMEMRGDSVIDGVPVVVVDVLATIRIATTGPLEGQPLTMTTELRGEESGSVFYAWGAGMLLHRSKAGSLSGVFRLEGGPQPMEFPQTMTYTSTIQKVR